MKRIAVICVFIVGVGVLCAQGGDIRRGKVVKLDLDKLAITLKVAEKDLEFKLDAETRVLGGQGTSIKDRMKHFKVGSDVMFKSDDKNGLALITHVKLVEPGAKRGLPKVDVTKLVPLPDLGEKEYQPGFQGGFYPGGKNTRPEAHEAAGLRLAKEVQPRNADGKPDPAGKIVMLSVGMSNTAQASGGFQRALNGYDKNPAFIFVNGAQGGMTAARIQDPASNDGAKYWGVVDQQLQKAGVTRAQVQVIWIKQADAGPSQGFPKYAKTLEAELARIVQIFPARFPNAKLVYLSSRTYGGYATSPLNPEPYAYESGFSVKWLIERQIKGDKDLNFDPKLGAVKAPWLSWGPYLWGNGSFTRDGGWNWAKEDFTSNDGTHLSPSGQDKVGRWMRDFFATDTTARTWFKAK